MSELDKQWDEDIAIVGAACRFPGNARDLAGFWDLLISGTDAVSTLIPDKFSPERFCGKSTQFVGHAYTACAGIIPDIKEFDPGFFGISRKEAMAMDPQQRLALEMAWEALESANIKPSSLKGTETGVFMGASNMDSCAEGQDDPAKIGPYAMTGTTLGLIANRISYFFDLHGPSMVLDTACSSSLVAVHQACQAIRRGEISLALAGGVNGIFAPMPFVGFSRARMLSPDGRCKVFDASGNGYVRSEGGGVIVLKSLAQAIRDKDSVLAVIAGSGVNSDGRTTGIALPNPQAQEDLLRKVYSDFKLDPAKLVYVEAHGTGTAAGDPLEAGAIGKVLGRSLAGVRPLPVGSVKTNIGHLEPASGIAGLMKSLLIFRHGVIPPNLHFKTPNPAIDFDALNIRVPVAPGELDDTGGGELISINSFGFGGTNAHVVLRKHGKQRRRGHPARGELCPPLFLSARGEAGLRGLALKYAALLEQAEPAQAYDIAATLAFKRDALDLRTVVAGKSRADMIAQLKKLNRSDSAALRQVTGKALARSGAGGVFVFSGNGSQWVGMGVDLLEHEPVFRAALEEVDGLLARYQDWSILDMLRRADGKSGQLTEEYKAECDLTEKSQPLLFAMQVGLVRVLRARGLAPAALIGHSVGEVAAAWAAGALSLEDAVTVIHYRSQLQAALRGQGEMAVAAMGMGDARDIIRKEKLVVEITAENSPTSLSLVGPARDLKIFLEACKSRRVAAKMLAIPYPFHSAAMESIKAELLRSLRGIKARRPKIPFYSTALEGKRNPLPTPGYWWRNIRQTVMFASAVQQAWDDGFRMFLEIGPSPVLRSYLRDTFKRREERCFVGAILSSGKSEAEELERGWKAAWQHGWAVDMSRHFPLSFQPAVLPAYCWEHEYLNEETTTESRGFKNQPRSHPLLGWPLPGKTPVFENTIHLADYPWLADHVAGSGSVMPAAAFVETMLAAAAQVHPSRGQQELEWVSIFRFLPLPVDGPRVTRVSVDREDGGLLFESRPYLSSESHARYARCRIAALADSPRPPRFDLSRPESFGLEIDKSQIYATARRFSLHYGPAFQTVDKAWLKADARQQEILARLKEGTPSSGPDMLVPPPMLDGAFQTLLMLLGGVDGERAHSYLPSLIERVTLYAQGRPAFAHARMERVSPRSVTASFHILDESGNTMLHLRNCRFRRAAWLEHERPPASAYAMRLMAGERPLAAGRGQGADIAELAGSLESVLRMDLPKACDRTRRQMNPYLLLQLTALNSMYETVKSLPGMDKIATGFTEEGLIRSGHLAPGQEQWLRAMLERLELAELAQRNGEEWQLLPRSNRPQATMLWRTLMSSSSGFLPEATLLSHVFRRGRDILRGAFGQEAGEAVPARLIDAYFINSLGLQPFARAVRRSVNHVLSTWKGEEPARILQLARNSEALLSYVLPLLEHSRCRYVVGEKDAAAAEAGSLLFDYNPALRFVGLNAEAPEAEHLGRYDLIIVAHAVHTRLNSSGMLAGCLAMLAPGGTLCMVEHAPNLFTDYVFGTDPAWWEASGEAGLPVSLMQDESYWRSQLELTGFRHVRGLDLGEDNLGPAFVLLAVRPESSKQECLAAAQAAPGEDAGASCLSSVASMSSVAPVASVPWLVAVGKSGSQSAGLGGQLLRLLKRSGNEAELVRFDGRNKDNWHKAFAGRGKFHVLYAMGYDSRTELELDELAAIQNDGLCGLAALASAWEATRPDMRLWVLTGGGLADGSDPCRPVPSQGALCGFSRVLANEMRTLPLRLIDVHGEYAAWAGQTGQADMLLAELLRKDARESDPEVVLAGGKCLVPRLDKLPKGGLVKAAPVNGERAKYGAVLAFDEPGRLQNLYWKTMELSKPGRGQVCVEVKYAGLNFRDVMWSMGLLQDEALENGFSGPSMGIECSGVIAALGEGVDDWNVGDEVLCFASACFGSHVLTSTSALAHKPENLGFAEAATVPVPFFTAWYSLKHLARLRPGERVLIHGAAGGVGLAAVQIASLLGLEIYATAGAPEKQNFLRQLGVKHIFSSRSTAFARQIMDLTQGQGVDAVLNSLAGEYISAGLSVLRPFGRFLELGKRDFYADTPMRLRPFSNNLSYFGVDVDQLLVHQPDLGQELFSELMHLFGERKLVPLPHTVYPCYKTVDAFRAMQQSSHIGKLVVSMEGAMSMAREDAPPPKAPCLAKDATYLVSGGTGGFGLAAARHLAANGAGHLLLLSRGGIRDEESRKIVAELRGKGVGVTVAKADVADAASLDRALKRHLKDMPRLAGIVHAAAVLDDGMITSLTPERVERPLQAKTHGAWNLHSLTRDLPLDFFLMFSSATTPFGNPGQSVYVAGNCMLETLCAWRRSLGLPAQVIGWGPIDDTGMLTRNPKARQMLLKLLGISPIASDEAMLWLDNVLADKVPASHYFGLDWNNRADLPVLRNPRFSLLRPHGAAAQGSEGPSLEDIRACPPREAVTMIAAILTEEIAHVLRMPKDRLAPDLSLVGLGMDSLTSVELGLAVEQRFELAGYTLPLSEKTTTLSLAQSLHAVICGASGQDGEGEGLQQTVQLMAEKHGVAISEREKVELIKNIKKR